MLKQKQGEGFLGRKTPFKSLFWGGAGIEQEWRKKFVSSTRGRCTAAMGDLFAIQERRLCRPAPGGKSHDW
jgi:hypothetical protein